MINYLNLFLLGLFSLFISCKDVEKNPSVYCDYDYIETEEGRCISIDYYTKDFRASLNSNVFSKSLISDLFIYDETYSRYSLNASNIQERLKPGSEILDLYDLYSELKSLGHNIEVLIDKINTNDDAYTFRDESNKLRQIAYIIKNNFYFMNDLITIMRNIDNRSEVEKYQILFNKLNQLSQTTEEMPFFIHMTQSDYLNFNIQLNDHSSSILEEIRIKLRQECETEIDTCKQEIKEDISNRFYYLYIQFLEDI